MYTIERFNNLITSLLSTNGRKEKEDILSQYKDDNDVKEIINFIFNPYIVTGISKKKLKKIPNINNGVYNPDTYNIMDLLTYIKNGHNTGKIEDLNKVEEYVRNLFPYKELIYKIISKDFKLGIQPLTINKIWKNHIPLFEVMLAEKYYDDPDKYLPDSMDFILTTKLDGCVIGSTEVWTEYGPQKISHIVDHKLNLKVLSFNEDTNSFEYKNIKNYLKKPLDKNLIKLFLENGKTLTVTEDDFLMLSNNTWVQAKDIKENDDLLDCSSFESNLIYKCPECDYKTSKHSSYLNHLSHCIHTKEKYKNDIYIKLEGSSFLDEYINGDSLYFLEKKYGIKRAYLISYLNSKNIHIRNSKEQANSKITKKRAEETNLLLYNGKTSSTHPKIKAKIKNTLKSKYGVENCSQIEGAMEKAILTKYEKYGTAMLSPKILISKLETIFGEYLQSKNIEFATQFIISKSPKKGQYRADFFIPSKNLVVEIFGDYWHANPNKFKENNFIYRFEGKMPAKKVWEMDKERCDIYKNKGFNYLILWESDILNNKYKNIFEVMYENL